MDSENVDFLWTILYTIYKNIHFLWVKETSPWDVILRTQNMFDREKMIISFGGGGGIVIYS